MFGIGWQELMLTAFVGLLIFGGTKLPEVGKSMGKAIAAFKAGLKEGENEPEEAPGSGEEKK